MTPIINILRQLRVLGILLSDRVFLKSLTILLKVSVSEEVEETELISWFSLEFISKAPCLFNALKLVRELLFPLVMWSLIESPAPNGSNAH